MAENKLKLGKPLTGNDGCLITPLNEYLPNWYECHVVWCDGSTGNYDFSTDQIVELLAESVSVGQ
jgi:hypothetical protein